jgi:hypothetical protein
MIFTFFAAALINIPATGVVELPAGETHLRWPLTIPKGSKHVTLRGNPKGSVLVLDAAFTGRAAIIADGVSDLTLEGFEIQGNRTDLKSDRYLPLKEAAFADFYPDNGIVVRRSDQVVVHDVHFSRIRTFPLIVNASSNVTVDALKIEDCGTLNRAGRNNTSGGILLEEGVSRFEVRNSTIDRITGNAIWTHSRARSPRASDGLIVGNRIATVGRDAIQVGHATRIRVQNNSGAELGFPPEYVDVENHGVAVALDTAGNVDQSAYVDNHFTDVNGQCIDLDGFHDGQVIGNSCTNKNPLDAYPALHYGIVFGNNNPAADSSGIVVTNNLVRGFAYGAVFLIGSGNRIENNVFFDINLAHCGTTPVTARCNYALDQPDLLSSGIYLSDNGGRPAVTKDNLIRANTIQGFGMKTHCMGAAKGVTLPPNANNCSD